MSYVSSAEPTTKPWVWVLSALGIGVGACVLSIVGVTIGAMNGSAVQAITLRGILAVIVLIGGMALVGRRETETVWPLLATAVASYALNPMAWGAGALWGQFTGSFPLALILDLVIWVVLGVGAALGAQALRQRRAR